MSGGAAIAAVTTALRHLLAEGVALEPELADTVFTTQTPDLARAEGVTANQLNLFLFRFAVAAAWTNAPPPGRARAGEDAPPPLALTLSYVLTAYGRDNDAQRPFSQWLLGRAMSVLHDHPILLPEALHASMPELATPRPFERVRLTWQPMTLDDLSKLWSGFQTEWRLSTVYEASVVLIESNRPVRAPVPVLRRGGGVQVLGDATPPVPALADITPASAKLGETVTLRGVHLAGERVRVRLLRDGAAWELPAEPGSTDRQVTLTLPANQGLAAGLHAACVLVGPAARVIASNSVALAIAPRITSVLPMTVHIRAGRVEVTLDVAPAVQPSQHVALLLGSRECLAPPRTQAQSRLHFNIPDLTQGDYLLRLRVDGVDTHAMRLQDDPPSFDPAARLTVTA